MRKLDSKHGRDIQSRRYAGKPRCLPTPDTSRRDYHQRRGWYAEVLNFAFYRQGRWREQIVPKTVIAQKNQIPNLAAFGVAVTSETAKALVKFLSDVENLNIDTIQRSEQPRKWGGVKTALCRIHPSLLSIKTADLTQFSAQ